ncbi:MAG: translation initiation factor IF-2 subunit alpha [Methanocellales archaeon]|nr:translation initiation factor IF-2 subunit alpha [Methanocellales archaeon]
MPIEKEYPEQGDLVVCTVKKVTDFGAFVSLDEYKGKEGLIHISEVASGWIKYIRDHVKEGQKIVCKVLNVSSKGHIDLSLKDVNEHQRKEKIQSWKNEQKAEKWMYIVAKSLGTDVEGLHDIVSTLFKEFGNLYTAFEETAASGAETLTKLGIQRKYADAIAKVAAENVKISQVNITGYVDLMCPLPNGVDVIKEALREAGKVEAPEVNLELSYVGAPRYRIKVVAPDYKKAENALRKAADTAIEVVRAKSGVGEFHRQLST